MILAIYVIHKLYERGASPLISTGMIACFLCKRPFHYRLRINCMAVLCLVAENSGHNPLIIPVIYPFNFYRAMHYSVKRGIAIACRLSVRLSVCLWRWWIVRGRWKCRSGKSRSGKIRSRQQGWKMQEWKMQEWKMREQTAGVENAGVENAGAITDGQP